MGANDVTKLFRQFDSVAPRRDGELIRRDIRTRARTSRGALRRVLVPPVAYRGCRPPFSNPSGAALRDFKAGYIHTALRRLEPGLSYMT